MAPWAELSTPLFVSVSLNRTVPPFSTETRPGGVRPAASVIGKLLVEDHFAAIDRDGSLIRDGAVERQ